MGVNINWILVAVISLVFLCVFNGYNKGFMRLMVSFSGTIVILIAVVFISPAISSFLLSNGEVVTSIQDKVKDTFISDNDELNTSKEEQIKSIENYELPEIIINSLISNNNEEVYSALMVTLFNEYVSLYITKLIINAAAFVGVFIVLNIIMKLLLSASDLVNKIPVFKGINRLLGAALGAAEGILFVWIFYFVVITFLGNEIGNSLMADIRKSDILLYLFNQNILMQYIS